MTDKHIPASKLLALPAYKIDGPDVILLSDLRALIDEAPEVESVCTLLAKDGFVWSTLWRVPIPDGKHFLYLSPPPSTDLTKLVGDLVEAVRLAKVTFIANNMDVRNVMQVIDETLTRAKEYLK
jgi:hypothetical protein